ncbi:MAG TPA: 2-oxoglutarate dehydrogenase complex dihydrolipoyllysine-residue succinyltransferase [Hyphomicrobiaceae bacterium]|nr:2-oxoglutarate dehydrogenase complex dihydrolipoyllysine-residue succinyltransferase [Hyphomicrobiaceae bacterium]
MAIEIRVPTLGESVTEATVGQWFKKPGDAVKADEPLVELETDKVTVEVPAPASGVLAAVAVEAGQTVEVGAVLGHVNEGAGGGKAAAPAAAQPSAAEHKAKAADPKPTAAESAGSAPAAPVGGDMPPSPAARKALDEAGLAAADVQGSGKRGQVLKGDVVAAVERGSIENSAPASAPGAANAPAGQAMTYMTAPQPVPLQQVRAPSVANDVVREERVKMTRLRQTIARRLKDAQNTAAMLTTFNDVDMSNVMALRKQYKDLFEKRHGAKLGFMGFFVKACIQALKEIPAVNAEIDGAEVIYKNYYHIGVAVGTEKGLVVPVVREADRLSLAEVEAKIAEFGKRARDGRLAIEDMQGGTFTITNGGVYGSMMSTPILNAPQSGILGMHRIEERPVVRNGEIVVRPMMYLALSYDHRIVDGKEAVTFLVRVKENLEDPQRFLLEL